MPEEEGRSRSREEFLVAKRLDKLSNPPKYLDDELPTKSVTLRSPMRVGRSRMPHGTAVGSYHITGSYTEFTAPGTNSLRITRLSLEAGSRETHWFVRHSRFGTQDIKYFPAPGQVEQLGDPLRPIYSFGPGTVTYGFLEAGSAAWLAQFMEGFVT